jgi:hypothetical protein
MHWTPVHVARRAAELLVTGAKLVYWMWVQAQANSALLVHWPLPVILPVWSKGRTWWTSPRTLPESTKSLACTFYGPMP